MASGLTCMPPGVTKAVRSEFRQTFASTGSAAQEQPLRIEFVWALPSPNHGTGGRCCHGCECRSLLIWAAPSSTVSWCPGGSLKRRTYSDRAPSTTRAVSGYPAVHRHQCEESRQRPRSRQIASQPYPCFRTIRLDSTDGAAGLSTRWPRAIAQLKTAVSMETVTGTVKRSTNRFQGGYWKTRGVGGTDGNKGECTGFALRMRAPISGGNRPCSTRVPSSCQNDRLVPGRGSNGERRAELVPPHARWAPAHGAPDPAVRLPRMACRQAAKRV